MVKQWRRRRTIWSQLIVDHVPPTHQVSPLSSRHLSSSSASAAASSVSPPWPSSWYICIGVYDDVRRVSLTHPILTRQQEVYWQSLQRKRESIKQGKVRVDLTKGHWPDKHWIIAQKSRNWKPCHTYWKLLKSILKAFDKAWDVF